jgi:hypothetical protein
MTDDWHKRYEAAHVEMEEARILWNEADSAMARANARRQRAEREFHRVFQERMDMIAGVSPPVKGGRNP